MSSMKQQSSLKIGPTMQSKGQKTNIRGNNKQKKEKTNFRTTDSDKHMDIVKHGDQIATPKDLITEKFKEMAKQYWQALQEHKEKFSASQSRRQTVLESSFNQESQDQSSEIKMSSSNNDAMQNSMDSRISEQSGDSSEKQKKRDDAKTKKKENRNLEQEGDDDVIINMEETETQFYLKIPSALIMRESPTFTEIYKKNQQYDNLLKIKVGSDNYNDRLSQTFNSQYKNKEVQCNRLVRSDVECMCTNYHLFDAVQEEQLNELEILQKAIKCSINDELQDKMKNPFCTLPTQLKNIVVHSKAEIPGEQQYNETKNQNRTQNRTNTNVLKTNEINDSGNQSSLNNTNSKLIRNPTQNQKVLKNNPTQNKTQLNAERQLIEQQESQALQEIIKNLQEKPSEEEQDLLNNKNLQQQLKYIDRILNLNTYHKQYTLYRNYPEVKIEKNIIDDDQQKRIGGFRQFQTRQIKEEQDGEETNAQESPLKMLFKFKCDITEGRTVSSADWNPVNQDLLAVSYGELDLNSNQEGIVAFWTLKNPTFPERSFKFPSRITTCQFSQHNPNLLAGGTHNGVVAIWDIRKAGGTPVCANNDQNSKGKHSDCVWEVQWVEKGAKGGESLVSIGSDGKIVEWSMKKGLEYTELMNLKRQNNPSQKEGQNEGVNFRQAAGFSFDFIKGEPNAYLAATEEATTYRCSKSYAEAYLESYYGHTGAIYKVRCNPFWSDIFLTCSADWSCKLWNWKSETSLNTFQSLDMFEEVNDIEWSPMCSTLFSSVGKDGRLELWDLKKNNMLDPFATEGLIEGEVQPSKTMTRFCNSASVIITGDVVGSVNVYRYLGYEDQGDAKNQQEKLQKLLYPTGYTKGREKEEDKIN